MDIYYDFSFSLFFKCKMLEEWRNQNKSLKSNSKRGGIDILDNNNMDSSIALTTVIRIRVSVWVGLLSL